MLKSRDYMWPTNGRIQRRRRFNAGFTLAELLIVVAILGVLAGVSFIAVQNHQKSLTQAQYDTIAKEIYVAAQNHLTLAKSENYQLQKDINTAKEEGFFGNEGTAVADGTNTDIFFFCSKDSNTSKALDQILPFGSIELITGGSFIIRYQPNAARVLDVFYWTDGSGRFDARLSGNEEDYKKLVGDDDKKDKHRNYDGSAVLGWFGGEEIVESGAYLVTPSIKVINEERLMVEVTDFNIINKDTRITALKPMLKLFVEGITSGAKAAIQLTQKNGDNVQALADPLPSFITRLDKVENNVTENIVNYTVILDDITTTGLQFAKFAKLSESGKDEYLTINYDTTKEPFIPGENVKIYAVAYSNKELTNVAYSGEWTTNSLFAEIKEQLGDDGLTTEKTVIISNIRHLENLNDSVSDVDYEDERLFNGTINAVQTKDLFWKDDKAETDDFVSAFSEAIKIYDKEGKPTKENCFLPVSASYVLSYNGQLPVQVLETEIKKENHSINGIVVDNTEASFDNVNILTGGVFGSLTGATIKNLALIDTNVTLTSGDAGTLAGSLTGSTVENVVAYNSTNASTANVTVTAGNAGGLIGSMNAKTELKKCAAAVIVEATDGKAGGLVGVATSTADNKCSVDGCYSGGHTINSNLTGSVAVIYDPDHFNVTASGIAGGLIGEAQATDISYCYSTCSAKGATAGGLIGTGGGAIGYSYCTGLVQGSTAEGAFAGTHNTDTGTLTECKYFMMINEREGYTYLNPVNDSATVAGLTAFDETAVEFNSFCGTRDQWLKATPYSERLKKYYVEGINYEYPLKSIMRLVELDAEHDPRLEVKEAEKVTVGTVETSTPADFVAIHYGDWPAPEIFVVNL